MLFPVEVLPGVTADHTQRQHVAFGGYLGSGCSGGGWSNSSLAMRQSAEPGEKMETKEELHREGDPVNKPATTHRAVGNLGSTTASPKWHCACNCTLVGERGVGSQKEVPRVPKSPRARTRAWGFKCFLPTFLRSIFLGRPWDSTGEFSALPQASYMGQKNTLGVSVSQIPSVVQRW